MSRIVSMLGYKRPEAATTALLFSPPSVAYCSNPYCSGSGDVRRVPGR
jgi:hypothetical protein